jgi:hypothetical protein
MQETVQVDDTKSTLDTALVEVEVDDPRPDEQATLTKKKVAEDPKPTRPPLGLWSRQ